MASSPRRTWRAEVVELGRRARAARIELTTDVTADLPFLHKVQHVPVPVPAYGGWAPRGNDVYSRLEVHLRDGGQGYDVMGYTHTQLIDDVLDQYERHLEFLRLTDGSGA